MPRHAAHFRIIRRGPIFQVRFTRAGKDHRYSTNHGDAAGAREAAARIVREHDAGGVCQVCAGAPPAPGASLAALSERWLNAAERSHGAKYRARAATDMVHYVEPRFKDPYEITSKAWEEWKLVLHETPTDRRERLSWGSIANLANTLRAFLRWCADGGVIESVPELKNPTGKQLAADRAYLRPLNEDEQEAFLWALALADEGRALRVYIALFQTWVRKGALEAMTPRWVRFERQTITIPSEYTKSQLGDVEIDLTPRAAEAIKAEMGEVVDLDRPIFGAFDFHQARDGGVFGRACKLAGIDMKGLTAHHVTRRTAATLAGAKPGASLNAIKSQGGWRTSEVVDKYMRANVEAARKVTR